MKTCIKCNHRLPFENFGFVKVRGKGPFMRTVCRVCMAQAKAVWRKNRKPQISMKVKEKKEVKKKHKHAFVHVKFDIWKCRECGKEKIAM